jgi:hypothetical protein
MALVPLVPAEDRLSTSMPAKAKARTFLNRTNLSPEPRALGQFVANQNGEIELLRMQLLESHSRVGTLTNYLVQDMGMIEEREAWWRRTASATIEERAVLMRQARAQEGALLDRMTQMGQALQSFSTDATLNESQRREQEHVIANLQTYANNLKSAGQDLERQRQQILSTAEARIQAMLSEATANYAAVER